MKICPVGADLFHRTEGQTDGQIDGRAGGRTDGRRTDRRTDGQANGQKDGRTDRHEAVSLRNFANPRKKTYELTKYLRVSASSR